MVGPAVLWVGVPWLSIFLPEILTVFRVCVLVCVCVCGVGGGWGEGRGGGLAGQQSRELVKLPITLNPPLEAQRGENSENVTLSPQKGSSEGRDFRGWGSGF